MKSLQEIKLISTLGPSSMKKNVIARLEEVGVGIFRINLSHTELKDLANIIRFIQSVTQVPICLDTEGAQIRTGSLRNKSIRLSLNDIIRVCRHSVLGDSRKFNFYPRNIISKLEVGDLINVDFNSVLLQVIDKKYAYLTLRVITGGTIGQNKAVSVERDIEMPHMTYKDRKALLLARKMGIRHVALSFASHAEDVHDIRAIMGRDAFIISKIESIKGIINLDEIRAASDALLLDRGDLSRQIPLEQIPRIQKDIIYDAKRWGVKIYVATNLLESMTKVPTPTRAEVNDIFNTLSDGADGLVLAAETAIGTYPVNCATMVSKIIKQFTPENRAATAIRPWGSASFSDGFFPERLKSNSSLLIEPHGGNLINRFRRDLDMKVIKKCKKLEVARSVLSDAEQIAFGAFSPLEGFMNKKELESVIRNYRLRNGIVWPLPILLQTTKKEALKLNPADKIALVLKDTREIYAILHLEDVYTYDLDKISLEIFGTINSDHFGVQEFKKRGEYFLGGKIELVKRLPSEYKHLELTPLQTRAIFDNKNWSKVVGFHTRNVIHRAHEYIQKLAIEKYNCDGIFIHPLTGSKKSGDYTADIVLRTYEFIINRYFPRERTLLAAFGSYPRFSGPREAVFTALCRKNFGCNYFIVGRYHAGIGKFYEPDAAQRLFGHIGDIGITPIFFDEFYYCKKCNAYLASCRHDKKYSLTISGSEGRRIFKSKKCPPNWFMRKDVSKFILNEIKKGKNIFTP